MKLKFGKKINPHKYKLEEVQNLKKFHERLSQQAKKYSADATIAVTECYVCASTSLSANFVTVYGFEYLKCENCSHIILSKRLSQKDENRFYLENTDYATTYTNKTQIAYRLKNIAKPKVSFVMNQIVQPQKGRWLDVGCAIGDVVKTVETRNNWEAVGVDISADSVTVGKKHLKVDLRLQTITDFFKENPKELFDIISFFGYFGITNDLHKEVKLARKHLKPGGYIVIGESNGHSMSTLIQQTYPELSTRHILPPNTVQQFTHDSMEKLLEITGFSPLAYWNFGLDYFEFIKTMVLLNNTFQDSPLYNFMTENLNQLQNVVDKKFMGDYFIVVAKKTNQ